MVHQQRKNQEQFLDSIQDRIQVKPISFVWALIDLKPQGYGTKYWTAVRGVGMVMEIFANYLRYARSIGAGSAEDKFDCKEYLKH